MSRNVTIIDYGMGNLFSVARAFSVCGANPTIAERAEQIEAADVLVLPGVGAFRDGMNELRRRGLVDPILGHVAKGRPLLGICLGMQMLMDQSSEFGCHKGLGLVPGEVVAIPGAGSRGPHKVPHIGWTETHACAAFQGTRLGQLFDGHRVPTYYFVHSYNVLPRSREHLLAVCSYNGVEISAAVSRAGITGCQFHPEKSGANGLQFIQNYLRIQ